MPQWCDYEQRAGEWEVMGEIDTDIIREGASKLREAVTMGRVTLAKIQSAQE